MTLLNPIEKLTHKKRGIRQKKSNPVIDMTPMVDLGFLLICFFVFTTTMNQPNTADLFLPKEGTPLPIKESASLTVIITKENKLFCYEGKWSEALQQNRVIETGYSLNNGLGSLIRLKQKKLIAAKGKEGRNSLMLIIKASKMASYKNLVDVLDEVLINDVRHYAIVDPGQEETRYLE